MADLAMETDVDFSEAPCQKRINSGEGRKWRTIIPGWAVEAFCPNAGCQSKRESTSVFINQGFNATPQGGIGMMNFHCPLCGRKDLEVYNVTFYQCAWTVRFKKVGEKEFSQSNVDEDAGDYQTWHHHGNNGSHPVHKYKSFVINVRQTSGPCWVVAWHVNDHARGALFCTESSARAKFADMDGGSWATKMYTPSLRSVSQYGWMSDANWHMLDTWAEQNNNNTKDFIPGAWFVIWHVNDHAEGAWYFSSHAAHVRYDVLDHGAWAARLYDPYGGVAKQYGCMSDANWRMLTRWREDHLDEL